MHHRAEQQYQCVMQTRILATDFNHDGVLRKRKTLIVENMGGSGHGKVLENQYGNVRR